MPPRAAAGAVVVFGQASSPPFLPFSSLSALVEKMGRVTIQYMVSPGAAERCLLWQGLGGMGVGSSHSCASHSLAAPRWQCASRPCAHACAGMAVPSAARLAPLHSWIHFFLGSIQLFLQGFTMMTITLAIMAGCFNLLRANSHWCGGAGRQERHACAGRAAGLQGLPCTRSCPSGCHVARDPALP